MITDLINESLICLDLKATTKHDVFNEMIEILYSQKRIGDKELFLQDVLAREELGNTGFEDGVALPHAKSNAVISPAVAIGISRSGIEYGAEDGLPSKLFFMIASPDNGANHHIEVLAELSSKLIEDGFIEKFLAVDNTHDALQLLLEEKAVVETSAKDKGFIIGVTGCPAGVAHTYLAAEALERAAAEMGYEIKVETNGSLGVENSPTAEEIARADAIVIGCDKQVDLTRFAGKRLIEKGVKAPIKDAKGLIEEALTAPAYEAVIGQKVSAEQGSSTHANSEQKKHASRFIPFLVAGGLLVALVLAMK